MATKSVVQVILMENIAHLGRLGDIVSVRWGYARNFLIPRGKVKRATDQNKKDFEVRRQELEGLQRERFEEAEVLAQSVSGITVQIIEKAGLDGRLFGSVGVLHIVKALQELGFKVPKAAVLLPQPIKVRGDHSVALQFHSDVSVTITVSVLGEN